MHLDGRTSDAAGLPREYFRGELARDGLMFRGAFHLQISRSSRMRIPELLIKFSRGNYAKFSAVLATVLLVMTPGSAPCQSTADLFRVTDGVTRNQMNFHQVSVPIGGEHVLADLTGPGKVTQDPRQV